MAFFLFFAFILIQGKTYAKGNFTPITQLKTSSPAKIPYVIDGIIDTRIIKKLGTDYVTLESILSAEKGKKVDKKRVQSQYVKLLEINLALSYIYMDRLSGKTQDNHSDSYNQDLLNKTNKEIVNYAKELTKILGKNANQKAKLEFYIYTAQFQQNIQSSSISGLKKLIKSKKLESFLERRAKFLVGIWEVERGERNQISILSSAANSLSSEAYVAANLAIAKYYGGISRTGGKSKKTDKKYSSYLNKASARSTRLSKKQQDVIRSYALGVWRKAEGNSGSWSPIPLHLTSLKPTPEYTGILERHALTLWKQKKYDNAISSYRSLKSRSLTNEEKAKIDLRILTFEKANYLRTNNFSNFEKAINSALVQYSGADSKNERAPVVVQDAMAKHDGLVQDELKIGLKKKTQKQRRSQTISLLYRYLNKNYQHTNKNIVLDKIGDLYTLNDDHNKAVDIYLSVAKSQQPPQNKVFLAKAIKSQSIVAKWPYPNPSWNKINPGPSEQRQKLQSIYKEMENSEPNSINWNNISHIGQLDIALNNENAAFTFWKQSLDKSPLGKNQSQAAGYMLTKYEKDKKWQDLETFAKFCEAKQIKPFNGKKPISLVAVISEALYQGGKEALDSKQYPVAISKLNEFINKYNHKNRDHGMALLATAYHENKDHKKSIETLLVFNETYPTSRYYATAMLNGGNWSIPLAYEENAIFFYNEYLKSIGSSKAPKAVLNTMKELYLGRTLYSEAIQTINKQLTSSLYSNEEKEELAIEQISIEYKFGSKSDALRLINKLLSKSITNSTRAEALGIKSRIVSTKDLYTIEKQLESINKTPDIEEYLGEVKFLIAGSMLGDLLEPVNSINLTDPLKTLQKKKSGFDKVRGKYFASCTAGRSSFCVPALFKSARISEDLIKVVEEINIAPTLADQVVQKFEATKNQVLADLTQKTISDDEQAWNKIPQGNTLPIWTQQIYWQNSSDMGFENISGSGGEAYIQWPITEK